jgi:hypothetical protein
VIIVLVLAVLGLISLAILILWDNIRLRRDLVIALTRPSGVAGELITSDRPKAEKAEPTPHPLGL